MKIKEGLNLRGRPAEIPDCGRFDLPEFFVEMGYKVGAEIGTAKGVFAEALCKVGLKLYCVDPWINYARYDDVKNQYLIAQKRLFPYDSHLIQKTSMEALADIPDESLDFVYIDANHEFKYVVEDIYEWSKKVRKGGCISGHDYYHTNREHDQIHVKYVLPAYTRAYKIDNWYVLGRTEKPKGETRDPFRSWFWLK